MRNDDRQNEKIDLHDEDTRTTTTMNIIEVVLQVVSRHPIHGENLFFFLTERGNRFREKRTERTQKNNPAHSFNPVSGVAKVDRSFTENLHTGIHACAHTHTHTDRHVVYTWSIAPHNPLLMKNFDSFHRVTEKCYYSGWEKHGCWLNGQIGETKKKLAVVLRNTTSGYKRLARTEMGMRTALGHWIESCWYLAARRL